MLEEGARAALERREPLEAAAKLRSALEIRDSAALRVLWGDLLSRALSWRFPTNGIVYDVEFSPDGRWLAAANQSGLVYQVSVDGLEVRRLRVQGDQVLAVAFSPDGALLASSTWAGAVSLWDTRTGALRSRWSHEGAIPSMSFSHDGRLLAAASSRGGVYVTELGPRPSSAHVAPGLPDTRSVEFGPEGDLLVAAGSDRAVWLLHARGGDEVRRFDLGAPIDAAAFSPDGTLVAASAGGSVAVWPAGGGPAVKTFRAAAERIRDLDFSPDSRRLAVGGYDRVLSEWDLATGEQLLSDTAPQWFVLSVDYCPTDGRLAAARGKALEIVRAGRRGSRGAAKRIALHDSPVLQVAFSPDGARVATSGGGIRVWDVASGLPTASIDAPLKVRGLRFGREGATLIAALEDGAIETWDATTGASLGRFELGPSRRAQCLGGDESVGFAVGCASGEVLLVDPRSGRVERSAILHAGPVVGAALVPGERRAVTAGRDGKVMSWDLDSGASTVLLQHPVPLATVAVSSDGATVAVADEDGAIMFLDRASATVRSTLRLDGRVYRVEFLPDGRRIAAACSDGLAHVFDLESSAQTTLRGHRREVNWLAVSPDGTLLATVSDDTTLRLHRLADGHALWHGLGPIGPSALTWGHRGWRNARGAAAERPGEPWASLVEAARLTSQDAEGLCVVTIDDRLVRWDFGAGRPAFERPAARAERVVAGAGGCLTLRDGDAALTTPTIERSLTTGATAAARDGERLLLATAREVLIFDRDGRRIERLSAEPGVTALHRSGGLLALGFAEGTIVLRRAGSSERSRDELQDTPISGVAVMQEGPSHTLVAGFENGFVGLWDLSTRVLLSHLHLHGAVTGVAYADGGIVAATDLGDQGTIELGTLEQPYCELLREVRREVPFLWQGGVIADRDPTVPAACRPETSPAASRGIDRRGVEPKSRGSHRRGGHGAPRGGW
jgi:WD40 repeat protein